MTLDVTFNAAKVSPFDGNLTLGFSATGALNADDFGIKGLKNLAIGPEVDFTIEVEATNSRNLETVGFQADASRLLDREAADPHAPCVVDSMLPRQPMAGTALQYAGTEVDCVITNLRSASVRGSPWFMKLQKGLQRGSRERRTVSIDRIDRP